jgi:phosphoenolpyruvate synthase/pyruvate phosphate dikinase
MEKLTPVAKIELLQGYVFRQNNPAVVGCEVLDGKIKSGMQIMNGEATPLTEIKSMQKEGETVSVAEKGERIAISMPNVTVGRQIKEGDILVAASTSPSWTPVFSLISGAVVDRGGSLSHAAIVGREYGIPVVINTFEGTQKIKEGQRIKIDANLGAVYLLD